MAATRKHNRATGPAIRAALTELLTKSPGPVPVRELVTAVYHVTDDDRVSYGNVSEGLRRLAADGVVRRVDRGLWEAVQS